MLRRGRRQNFDPRCRSNDDHRAAPDKEPALDRTDGHRDVSFDLAWIGERAEPAIKDVIAAVRDKRLLTGRVAPLGNAAELGERDDLALLWRDLEGRGLGDAHSVGR